MTLGSREHEEIIAMFDREFSHLRLDKEAREFWNQGNIYQNGEANNLFLAYRKGFAFGKATAA